MKRLHPLLIAIVIVSVACQREVSDDINQDTKLTKITEFHETARKEQQSFTVNSSAANTVATTKGSTISMPANCFVTEDGVPVTGNINVSIKEIFTPVEMILNDMPTMAGNRLLESGGEFKITASQNNRPLKLAPGNYIKINIPDIGRNMQGMQVFNGAEDAAGNVNWVLNSNPGNLVVGDSSMFSKSNLFCDSINWINCDKFIDEPTVTFTVHPGNAPSGDSTNVFVHLTGRNTVVKMGWTQGLSYFTSNMLLAVPSTIVGISIKNGQFFASITPVNVQNGQSVTMNFRAYSEQELKARLSQLQ
ncbi:MAG TPA: hypothetical protein VGD17_01380 [Chitinophagaceae bacterium]